MATQPTRSDAVSELARSVSAAAHLTAETVNFLGTLRDADLFAALGYRLKLSSAGSLQADALGPLDVDELPRDTALQEMGRKLFHRWNKVLFEFICKAGGDDQALRARLITTITGKEGGATALLAGTLVAVFGVSPALSAIIATLVMRLVVNPAKDELCKSWELSV